MANNKLLPYIREEGYCCLWAWLEANRRVTTLTLLERVKHILSLRALQWNRHRYRHGGTRCEKCKGCLKRQLNQTIP